MRSKEGFACLLVFLIVCFFKLIFLFVSFCFGFLINILICIFYFMSFFIISFKGSFVGGTTRVKVGMEELGNEWG